MPTLQESLLEYIKKWNVQHEHNMSLSVSEALWELYSAEDPVDDGTIREIHKKLAPAMEVLTLEQADTLFELIVDLCIAYQRSAFLDGFTIGIKFGMNLNQT